MWHRLLAFIVSQSVKLYIVGCRGVVQLGGSVSRYYRVVPPMWALVNSVLFTNLYFSGE